MSQSTGTGTALVCTDDLDDLLGGSTSSDDGVVRIVLDATASMDRLLRVVAKTMTAVITTTVTRSGKEIAFQVLLTRDYHEGFLEDGKILEVSDVVRVTLSDDETVVIDEAMEAMIAFLENADATGGGDYEESHEYALQHIAHLDEPTICVILASDAPPHGRSQLQAHARRYDLGQPLTAISIARNLGIDGVPVHTLGVPHHGRVDAETAKALAGMAKASTGAYGEFNPSQQDDVVHMLVTAILGSISPESAMRYIADQSGMSAAAQQFGDQFKD